MPKDDAGLAALPRRNEWENAEAIHQELRAAILRNELAPGMVLNQVHLARRLGVSRIPLREALRMLQREGLIEGESNKKLHVTSLSFRELEDLYAMRILLEGLAIRMAVPTLSLDQLRSARTCLGEMQSHAQTHDYAAWEVPHRQFHLILVSGVGPLLAREIREFSDHAERYRHAYTTQVPWAWARGIREHQDILTACTKRDPSLAAERLARHYSSVVLGLLAALAPEHEPVAVRTAMRIASGTAVPTPGPVRPGRRGQQRRQERGASSNNA